MSYAMLTRAHRAPRTALGASQGEVPRWWQVWAMPQFPGDPQGWNWVGWTWGNACQLARLNNLELNCRDQIAIRTVEGIVMDTGRLRRICSGVEVL